ncbi:MAG: lysophospholipid acyltransferase family protein [Paludibacter sp.]|nr:lysophospholipid acyltransferase family protein [Paludibacter sp.]
MFYLFYVFIWILAWLPLKVLYLFSDLLYPLVYYVVGYRKKVTRQNLYNSFPEKSTKELRHIERKFYRFFCDVIIENIYLIHASKKDMKKRFEATDAASKVIDFYNQGKSVMIMTAHYCNWEWGSAFSLYLPEDKPMYNIYKQLTNGHFDSFMKVNRERLGSRNVEMKSLLRKMISLKQTNELACFGMIADQSPRRKLIHYWTNFLNQETPVIDGTEQLAHKFNYPVVYIHINRIKRGYYKCTYHIISEDPSKETPFSITEKYARILEKEIQKKPEYWLWTHKRWKHKKEN